LGAGAPLCAGQRQPVSTRTAGVAHLTGFSGSGAACGGRAGQAGHQAQGHAEYWADGPSSELPPGHWELFAAFVSKRDHHTMAQDVKLFFALANAIHDAAIPARCT
jgi:hypothetical protein